MTALRIQDCSLVAARGPSQFLSLRRILQPPGVLGNHIPVLEPREETLTYPKWALLRGTTMEGRMGEV